VSVGGGGVIVTSMVAASSWWPRSPPSVTDFALNVAVAKPPKKAGVKVLGPVATAG
jgi:hypothetical protein